MKRILYIICLAFASFGVVSAQTAGTNGRLALKDVKVEKSGDKAVITADIVLDALKLKSNRSLVVTPVISSADGKTTRALPSVLLNGRKRSVITERRLMSQDTLPQYKEAVQVVRRKNKKAQVVSYTAEVAYDRWMRNGKLYLLEHEKGCADCSKGENNTPLLARIFPFTPEANFIASTITPKAEEVKLRDEKFAASFSYRVNRTELLRDFGQNNAKLQEVDRVVNTIKSKKNIKVSVVNIVGYASPEGSTDGNWALSKGRALSFQNYMMKVHGFAPNQLQSNWHGEDWEGLEKAAEEGNFSGREQVLSILRSTSSSAERKARLKTLPIYRYLLDNVYPSLRRNEYTVSYAVANFSIEEAREIIKTDPSLLSLNEMYLVAQSYPAGSAERIFAIETAYKHFPKAIEAIVNKSQLLLAQNKADEAIALLQGVNHSEAINNLGVAYAQKKDFANARQCFERAAQSGNENAKANLTQLENYVDNL